ncbi:MAG: NERD domain-containing protein [Sedimenticola sp.]|nr:NERD domain-containing protein [Sedimenticola sp.]
MFSLTPDQSLWLAIAAIALLLLLLVYFLWKKASPTLKQYRIRRAVKRLGPKVHQGLMVPDGIDGVVAADYVVLTHKGILLITVNWFDGNIFGGKDTDQWTQVLRGGSNRFTNPLHEIHLLCATVKSLVPAIPVSGMVLFAGECAFPKDKPKGACLLSDLPKQRRKQAVPSSYELTWDLLLTKAKMLSFH